MEWVRKNIPNQPLEANERIKVLEDALKEILERHLWADDKPNAGVMMDIARAAMEVK
jgi:hypothetical protein